MKRVYEFLEKTDEGKEILEVLKGQMDQFKDLSAKSRIATKELEALRTIKAKLEEAGIDVEEIDTLKQSTEGKTALEQQVNLLTKQLNTITKSLEIEKAEREKVSKEASLQKLRNEFGSPLKDVFGKFGDVLIDNLIGNGSVKFDEQGQVIYETAEGVHNKTDAIEKLKTEYKEYVTPKNTGSGFPPPSKNTNANILLNEKTDSTELLKAGLGIGQ